MNRLRMEVGALGAFLALLAFPLPAPCQQPAALGARAPEVQAAARAHPTLPIGSPAPDFSLPGVDGKSHRLRDYAGKPVLAVLFTCVHCPTAQLYEGRVQKLYDDYRNKGVSFVAINPNDPAAETHVELAYTDVSDDLEGMQARAEHRRISYPFLFDGQTQAASRQYGPVVTPHIFIFGKDRKLRYEGRLDDNQSEPLVKVRDARSALDAILAGKPVPVPTRAGVRMRHEVEGPKPGQAAAGGEDRRRSRYAEPGYGRRAQETARQRRRQVVDGQLLGHLVRPLH